ncbi:site-specific DNA-methyltransferase [Elizabethkingia anophelis]|nr:site-specific DNA-methyltransferase [Elizabethkingia anophelis]MDV3617240.1 site-specific DNA-methyltransferase [Elizabethkingia anophelis]
MKKGELNKVYNYDARNILEYLDSDVRIRSTITSPPYFDMKDYGSESQIGYGQSYNVYLDDLKKIFEDIYKITESDGSLWIIIDTFKRENQVVTLPFDLTNKLKEAGWLLQDIIIWKKDKTVPWSSKGFMQRKFEYILFFSKSNNFKYNKDKVRNFDTNQLKKWWVKYPERYNPKGKALDEIWEFPIPVQGSWGDEYIRHFCPLPKEMVATMIEISTDKEDIILDPFAGSGSVLFQSAVMARKYVGFELNSEYIEMFQNYLKETFDKSHDEYNKSCQETDQAVFEKRILNLRALKYGRLLGAKIKKDSGIDVKVYVEVKEYLKDSPKLMNVEYKIIGDFREVNEIFIRELVMSYINKPPFSKFGIIPEVSYSENLNLDEGGIYYGYTATNSYSYSDLPIESSQVKVVSEICVNLNENDYI